MTVFFPYTSSGLCCLKLKQKGKISQAPVLFSGCRGGFSYLTLLFGWGTVLGQPSPAQCCASSSSKRCFWKSEKISYFLQSIGLWPCRHCPSSSGFVNILSTVLSDIKPVGSLCLYHLLGEGNPGIHWLQCKEILLLSNDHLLWPL